MNFRKSLSVILSLVILFSLPMHCLAAEEIIEAVNSGEYYLNSGSTNSPSVGVVNGKLINEYEIKDGGSVGTNSKTCKTNNSNGNDSENLNNVLYQSNVPEGNYYGINTNQGTVTTNNGTIGINDRYSDDVASHGTVVTNNGTIISNEANVTTNNGTITNNIDSENVPYAEVTTNETDGIVTNNGGDTSDDNGKVVTNKGTIINNNVGGVVEVNSGKIINNYATINDNNTNIGTIENNYGTIVFNKDVTNDNGFIINNYGSLENAKKDTIKIDDKDTVVWIDAGEATKKIYAITYLKYGVDLSTYDKTTDYLAQYTEAVSKTKNKSEYIDKSKTTYLPEVTPEPDASETPVSPTPTPVAAYTIESGLSDETTSYLLNKESATGATLNHWVDILNGNEEYSLSDDKLSLFSITKAMILMPVVTLNQTGGNDNEQTGDNGNEQTGGNDNEQTGDNGNEQTGGNGNEQTGGNGNEQTGGNGNEQTGGNGNEQTGGNGNEQTGGNGNEQTGGNGNEQTGGNGNEQTGDDQNKKVDDNDKQKNLSSDNNSQTSNTTLKTNEVIKNDEELIKDKDEVTTTLSNPEGVKIDVIVVGDKVSTSTITKEKILESINEKNSNGIILVDVSKVNDDISKVEFSKDSIKNIADSEATGLKAVMTIGSMTLNKSAITNVSGMTEEEGLILVVEEINEDNLSKAQKDTINTAKKDDKVVAVVDSYILSAKDKIKNLNGGKATLEINTEELGITDALAKSLIIYEVAEDGTLTRIDYEFIDGQIVFDAKILATYMFVKE